MASYFFDEVQVTLVGPGGSISLGSGAGNAQEGITVEFLEDKNNMLVGADGTVVHSLRMNKSARITVRLLKTSPTNAQLATMYRTQIGSSLNWGQNILTVTNIATGDNYSCTDVAFQKFPSVTWAQDANVNEWVFIAGSADPILGAGLAAMVSSIGSAIGGAIGGIV